MLKTIFPHQRNSDLEQTCFISNFYLLYKENHSKKISLREAFDNILYLKEFDLLLISVKEKTFFAKADIV